MQYTIDTLNIEIARLHKNIRRLKNILPEDGEESIIQDKISEFEGNIRELRKAIGVLKEYVKSQQNNQPGGTYTSRYLENPPR
jgi:hypothetical protein